MKRCLALLLVLAVANVAYAQDHVLKIEISSGNQKYQIAAPGAYMPICVPLSVPKEWAELKAANYEYRDDDDKDLKRFGGTFRGVAQLTAPGIMTESIMPAKDGLVRRDLHLLWYKTMAPGKSWTLTVSFKKPADGADSDPNRKLAWIEKKGEYVELTEIRNEKNFPLLRYVNRPYDASSKEAREKSYKVFHHLYHYDPTGKHLITSGGFADDGIADPKKILYPHHRGIMYGFNKCSYGPDLKKKADTWHCTGDAHVAHLKTLSEETGPILGRHRVLLGWFGEKNEQFAVEERELTVYHFGGFGMANWGDSTLVEFASRLKTTGGKVRVDGDPQHAGFQFRASNDVAEKTKKLTFYLHPDGSVGEMGKERNWSKEKPDKSMVDLPWYMMSFVLNKNRYYVYYLNHPSNPKETRFSERDYGRFGGYFEADITKERPLVVNYRLWVQDHGQVVDAPPADLAAGRKDQAENWWRAFATPPTAVVK